MYISIEELLDIMRYYLIIWQWSFTDVNIFNTLLC